MLHKAWDMLHRTVNKDMIRCNPSSQVSIDPQVVYPLRFSIHPQVVDPLRLSIHAQFVHPSGCPSILRLSNHPHVVQPSSSCPSVHRLSILTGCPSSGCPSSHDVHPTGCTSSSCPASCFTIHQHVHPSDCRSMHQVVYPSLGCPSIPSLSIHPHRRPS
jgi:hypothetical protein